LQGQLTLTISPRRMVVLVFAVGVALLLAATTGYWLHSPPTVNVTTPSTIAAPAPAAPSSEAADPFEGSAPAITGGDPRVAEPGS
jgi:hypothetical protein